MFLVLGLGNPGPKYADTRHNVGFLVVDRLARRASIAMDKRQKNARIGKVRMGTTPVWLAKPWTFMNRSGGPGQALQAFYKIGTEQVVVIHDDMDIQVGDVRIKRGGGHGGHNGLRDLKARLSAGDFARVRVGVGRPPAGWDAADYVLGRWTADECSRLPDIVDTAADAVETIVREGLDAAMNRFNVRTDRKAGPPENPTTA